MARKRNTLLALALISVVLVGVSMLPPASATTLVDQNAPSLGGMTKLATGLWYRVDYIPPGVSLLNRTSGASSSYELFAFGGLTYGILSTSTYDANTTSKVSYYRVTLLSDPDESLASGRISGDEVRVVTTGLLINGTFKWQQALNHFWLRLGPSGHWLDGTELTGLNAAISSAISLLPIGDLRRYLEWGLSLMTNATNSAPLTKYAYFTYMIDEDFLPKLARIDAGFDAAVMQLRHRLLGFVAYNDTNPTNGVMDIKLGTAMGSPAVLSSEAKYVFKASSFSNEHRTLPTYDPVTNSVNWDMGTTMNGTLVGVRSTIPNVNTNITDVTFAFHFTRIGNEAGVKVDEHIGQFGAAGTPAVNGLSLAIAYFSFVDYVGMHRHYTMNMTADNGSGMNTESNSTSTKDLGIAADGTTTGKIQIGGNNYTWGWDNNNYTANSNVIPWFFFLEQFATVGNYSVTGFTFGRLMYFYEACFSKWSGYSIVHDPYFAVTSFSPSEGSPTLLLIVLGAGVGVGVAAVAVLLVKRRKPVATI
ncbi:MAG: hypothetical protein WED05_11185 [Candidatus Atabeyarchaeum deiterrae]